MKFFIHIPKNGGMTIRHSDVLKKKIMIAKKDKLKSPEYVKQLKNKMKSTGDHHGIEHARYIDVNPAYLNNGAFAIVRNPWSKVVSRFMFAKQVIDAGKAPADYADVSSLDAFIEERHKWGKEKYMWHRAVRGWYPQMDHVINLNGEVSCDIMRLEYLEKDLEKYFKIKQMSGPRNVTEARVDYKDLYNKNTIQIIADWYRKDIDYWNFDFDTPARSNIWNID
jgi:ribosomal protein S18